MDEKRQEAVMHEFNGDEALGGSVMAAYKDALKYLKRFSDESTDSVFDGLKDRGPGGFMAELALNSARLAAAIETVAFVFGKTEDQVRLDAMKLVFGEEH